jgi:hypothetical protein
LTLNISETDNTQDLSLVRDVARTFRVTARKADAIITEVVTVVRTWRTEAEKARLSRTEQERMAPAFRVAKRTPLSIVLMIESARMTALRACAPTARSNCGCVRIPSVPSERAAARACGRRPFTFSALISGVCPV